MKNAKLQFVESLALKVSAQVFPEYVKKTAAEIADEIRATAEVYVSAELTKKKTTRGQSKIGGKPDVSASFEWPCEDGTDSPLAFLAQINLEEVAPHDFDKQLPAQGMLWFFTIADGDRAYGGEIDSTTTAVLYEPNPGPLKARTLPEELQENEDATIEERGLAFGPCLSVAGRMDSGIREIMDSCLRALGGKSGPLLMLDTDEASEGITLADFDGYAIAQNAFGECALRFELAPADLKRGALEKAEISVDPGT
jgi:hypothetical protein